jgi:hypothetical protein
VVLIRALHVMTMVDAGYLQKFVLIMDRENLTSKDSRDRDPNRRRSIPTLRSAGIT